MNKFIVIELQTNADGSVGILTEKKDEQNVAESVWHSKMSSAAISKVPVHTVLLVKSNGAVLLNGTYDHTENAE